MARFLSNASAAALAVAATALSCSDPSSPDPVAAPGVESSSLRVDPPRLRVQQSGTINRLQAISPVDADVVWASGVGGTFVRTLDGGRNWEAGVVEGAELLQFRDVHGVSATEAYLLAAGVGTDSRIYKTVDGGATWTLQFTNQHPKGFYDCFDFWTPERGLVMGDAVNGIIPVVQTRNGGDDWRRIGGRLPPAQLGEAAFAASGTCVATQGSDRAWIATGAAEKARILATTDGGKTWEAYLTPIVQGTPASGLFTVAFRDASHGILAGGDLEAPDALSDNVARSKDGGKTWQLVSGTPFPGAAYGLSYVPSRNDQYERTVVITGPGGAAWTANEGKRWHLIPEVRDYWAVAFADRHHGWLVGTEGRILKVVF
ncbi:MAG: glycosyl hydrolase [Gemmatimonadales bacterium]|nr:glycosyl hydrolase [Gemmatimonadales bacterium]